MYKIDSVALKVKMLTTGIKNVDELAKKAKLSRPTVYAMMKSSKKPGLSAIYKLADALNLSDEEAGKIFFAKVIA